MWMHCFFLIFSIFFNILSFEKNALRRNHISQFPDVEATFLKSQLIFVYILSLYHYPPESEESARDYYNSSLKRYAKTD